MSQQEAEVAELQRELSGQTAQTAITPEERERFDPILGKRAEALAGNPFEYWWEIEQASRVRIKFPHTPDEDRPKYHAALKYALQKQGFKTYQG